MIKLKNGCYTSDIKVHPKNWQSTRASTKKDWYIFYRFYDPSFKKYVHFKKGKLILIRGMNVYKTLPERQKETINLIEGEKKKILDSFFNPIKNINTPTIINSNEITGNTPFLEALIQIEKLVKGADSTKRDLRSVLNFISLAAKQLGLSNTPTNTITRKHIKTLLLQIESNKKFESPHRFNKVRSYLMILYKELVEMEVVDTNPVKDISKMKTTQRLRRLIPIEKRKIIDGELKLNHYRFWLFTNIFFHSGARLTELMKVKVKHVDLKNQSFIVTIKKGQQYKEVIKPIKDIALYYWRQAIKSTVPDDYIFSKDLQPGKNEIRSFQITKRWNLHIKKKLGIQEDFYSLKHLNLDETAGILNLDDAAAMASHTSTSVTAKYYTPNEKGRQIERLKKVKNKFA